VNGNSTNEWEGIVPNDEFVIDNEKISRIAQAFKIEKKSVDGLFLQYRSLADNIKNLYLAHIMRAMEKYFREKTGNPLFIISCEPYKVHVPGQKDCSAYYIPSKRFVIFFNSALDEKKIRIGIAHELGHLFLYASNDLKEGKKIIPKYGRTTEPLSSIFGIFIISDKNHFYQEYTQHFNHSLWEDIVQDFVLLQGSAGA
jgi:hypothetical protein